MSTISIRPSLPLWPRPHDEDRLQEAASSAPADIQAIGLWEQREAELLAIRKFQDDWDGFGAEAPDPNLVDVAVAFLEELCRRDPSDPPMRVTLSPDGFVAMEWQKGDNFLRAEVATDSAVEWMR